MKEMISWGSSSRSSIVITPQCSIHPTLHKSACSSAYLSHIEKLQKCDFSQIFPPAPVFQSRCYLSRPSLSPTSWPAEASLSLLLISWSKALSLASRHPNVGQGQYEGLLVSILALMSRTMSSLLDRNHCPMTHWQWGHQTFDIWNVSKNSSILAG